MSKQNLNEGTKYDLEKNRLDLIPPELEEAIGTVLTFGSKKYDSHNWRKGIKYSRVLAALQRHLLAYRKGEIYDPESGLPHLWHLGCNLAFLITFEAHPEIYKNFNDLYKYKKKERDAKKEKQ